MASFGAVLWMGFPNGCAMSGMAMAEIVSPSEKTIQYIAGIFMADAKVFLSCYRSAMVSGEATPPPTTAWAIVGASIASKTNPKRTKSDFILPFLT
jgi:hypothetical protein